MRSITHPVRAFTVTMLLCMGPAALAAALPATSSAPAAPAQTGDPASMQTTVPVYDRDYPFIRYGDAPVHNPVVQLLDRLARGEVQLQYGAHGYLDSLLTALDIDPDSQVLVFSKTSLQIDAITAQTPRAVYFNDDTYIGFVLGTGLMEVAAMDADRGAVFYTFNTLTGPDPSNHRWRLDREAPRCLTCHDSYAESGGGVPVFMFESAYSLQDMDVIFGEAAHETTEQDPVAGRWGGWYVTGDDGGAFHLGNIQPPISRSQATTHTSVLRENARQSTAQSLDALVDVKRYIRPSSDLVSLLVLQHEVDVHNALVRANYKSRTLFARNPQDKVDAGTHWNDMPAGMQKKLTTLLEPLVRAMLMSEAAPLGAPGSGPMKGDTGFAARFQARGPRDSQGRSLRELDLRTRTFKYPMTFLVYSEAFDFLPVGVREHVYTRFRDILSGRDRSGSYGRLDSAAATAALEILKATKPDFSRELQVSSGS